MRARHRSETGGPLFNGPKLTQSSHCAMKKQTPPKKGVAPNSSIKLDAHPLASHLGGSAAASLPKVLGQPSARFKCRVDSENKPPGGGQTAGGIRGSDLGTAFGGWNESGGQDLEPRFFLQYSGWTLTRKCGGGLWRCGDLPIFVQINTS